MKKLILKTAIITLCITLVLAISIFGIISFGAPAAMMDFTASLGLKSASGDYAYEYYTRSAELPYLARSAELAYDCKDYETAHERLCALIENEGFSDLCAARDEATQNAGSYAQYVFGMTACAKYRLGEKDAAAEFAVRNTPADFPEYSAAVSLALEGIAANDGEFCASFRETLISANFENSKALQDILNILEEKE